MSDGFWIAGFRSAIIFAAMECDKLEAELAKSAAQTDLERVHKMGAVNLAGCRIRELLNVVKHPDPDVVTVADPDVNGNSTNRARK